MYPNLIKQNRRMPTCNRLDLQTLETQPVMPQKSPRSLGSTTVILPPRSLHRVDIEHGVSPYIWQLHPMSPGSHFLFDFKCRNQILFQLSKKLCLSVNKFLHIDQITHYCPDWQSNPFYILGQCPGSFWAYRVGQDPSDSNPTGYSLSSFEIDIFISFLQKSWTSTGSSATKVPLFPGHSTGLSFELARDNNFFHGLESHPSNNLGVLTERERERDAET